MNDEGVPPIVQLERLSYRYPTGLLALDDISFTVCAGERVGLVGPSGAGKSTLLMHLNGLLPARDAPATNGLPAVRIGGLAVQKQTLAEVRRHVGFLFQDPDDQLFCPTVREDVAFGPLNAGLARDEVLRVVAESLDSVGLADYGHRSTVQLSLGERKRVCLAGVLACRPTVLALDEPFSNLDPRARRTLTAILAAFQGTQIIATHDLDIVAELCSRVIVLDGGRSCADGPPEHVLADDALMEAHGLEVPLQLRLPKR